ncbi:MAG: HNH endonuclease [Elusimicrobia bacterium]|nr:HNH endonuclease [Elusimicrobiota bacterium]
MRFWWVNQGQTFDHEFHGGYLWSPKKKAHGVRHQFYENMREVAPQDVIFSFRARKIVAVSVAQSYAYESPKPAEFGLAGPNWEKIGWRVDVAYIVPHNQIEPREHMAVLAPLLPKRYAPLQPNGDGLQGVYLAEVPRIFAEVLAGLIGEDVRQLVSVVADRPSVVGSAAKGLDEWEEHIQMDLVKDRSIPETEKSAIIKARRGQGLFKQHVMEIEKECRITKVDNPVHLIGSHIKPWRDSSNEERLDGENGLLLTPSIDHLFDRGFISFENNGDVLVSRVADDVSLTRMGVRAGERVNVGGFTHQQRLYLDFHRESVFLQAQ